MMMNNFQKKKKKKKIDFTQYKKNKKLESYELLKQTDEFKHWNKLLLEVQEAKTKINHYKKECNIIIEHLFIKTNIPMYMFSEQSHKINSWNDLLSEEYLNKPITRIPMNKLI